MRGKPIVTIVPAPVFHFVKSPLTDSSYCSVLKVFRGKALQPCAVLGVKSENPAS